MRVLFMGTPHYAAVVLRYMAANGMSPYAAITQADKPVGRGRKMAPSPVKVAALELGIEVWQPEIINVQWRQTIVDSKPDVIAVAAYGKILRPAVLATPPLGCVNAHASLLPRHRGASPVAHAILEGDPVTGVTTMMMDEGIDTGDILLSEEVPIQPEDTVVSLTGKLAQSAGPLMVKTIQLLEQGICPRTPQDHERATYAPMLDKKDGLLDFCLSSVVLERKVRATWPWPGAYTCLRGKTLKIHEAEAVAGTKGEPGAIVDIVNDGILVACGEGGLLLKQIQAEGKCCLCASDFVRGARLQTGERCTVQ